MLLETVLERFNLNMESGDPADLAILYEVTGYQADSPLDDADFWADYANFKDQASINGWGDVD